MQIFLLCRTNYMHVIKGTIPFLIAKSTLKEHWSELKEIMKMNNFICAPTWPFWLLNKYLFFIYPPFVAQKETFFHEMMEFRLKSCVFISCFYVSGLTNSKLEAGNAIKRFHTKICKATGASLHTLLFQVVFSGMNQPDTFEDGRVFKNHCCKHSVTVVINCGSPLGKWSLDKHITKPLSGVQVLWREHWKEFCFRI